MNHSVGNLIDVSIVNPTTQTVSTVLGRGRGKPAVELNRPHGVCFERGALYVVDSGNNRILRVDPDRN